MAQKITESALLQCDKGTTPAQLKVDSQQFFYVAGKLVATAEDKKGMKNIPAFGMCTITRKNCTPAPIAWQDTSQKDDINDMKLLTEKSSCMCSQGGKITIHQVGHEETHSVE
ncbi:uncharacterized protein DUF4280 [Chitinophaga polysaccharea]|uniref:Uncharacterized protein DUF4280 n=1 Tax=Chitinophaga polysaccharea TaxID=1293035 RepID=A0A561Q5R7_9BACT|nr:DUF4280 domain-containing protein [Chitinophaga polysaccharea]TWF45693.1 uncharacterized protein DUF4280 [Chitinophaga polysaccharea]